MTNKLYLLSHGAYRKIGITADPQRRLVEVRHAYSMPFCIVHVWERSDARHAEFLVRQTLKDRRVKGTEELFKVPLDAALEAVRIALAFCDAGDWSSFRKDQLPGKLRHLTPHRGRYAEFADRVALVKST